MSKQILNNLEQYSVIRGKINDNFTELYKNAVVETSTTLTISAGVITVVNTVHDILGEGGSGVDDSLDTINGYSAEQLLFIRPNGNAGSITITNDGNIVTPTGENYTIPSNGMVLMQYDGSKWRMVGSSGFPIANNEFITWVDNVGNVVNVMKLNVSNEIEFAKTLNVGPIEFEADSGAVTAMNMPVTSESSDGDEMSMALSIDSNPALKVKGSADGIGGIDGIQLVVYGGIVLNGDSLVDVDSSTYTVKESDLVLLVSYTSTGACTITIPSSQILTKRKIIIKDSGGLAGTNNITIATEGSETIDGSATLVIDGNYESATIVSDGTNLFII
jgi:hypothetical protein